MEEENLCSSLTETRDPVLHQPQQTSTDHRYLNGDQEAVVWGNTEVQINQAQGSELLSPKRDHETLEETEQWKEIIWPIHPMSCTAAPLFCATVQWDMPDPSTETPSLMTDSFLANETACDGTMTYLGTSSLSLHSQDANTEQLFIQGEREEQDGFDSRLLLYSELECTGNDSEPCDTVDVQERATQEEEDSTNRLLDSNTESSHSTDVEEDEAHAVKPDAVDTVDLTCTPVETESTGTGLDIIAALRPEEEEEEPDVLLSGQAESEEEQTLANGDDIEEENKEGNEVEEEQIVSEEIEEADFTVCQSDTEVPAESITDETGLTINPIPVESLKDSQHLRNETEEATDIPQQLYEDPTEEPEMCEDMIQDVDPEQSHTVEQTDSDEEPMQAAEDTEMPELTKKHEQKVCLEEGSAQMIVTFESYQVQAEVESQDSKGPEQEMTEQSTQPEAEESDVVEQQEQMGPSEVDEQSLLTANPQATLSEQSGKDPEKIDESEITEQLPPETVDTQPAVEDGSLQEGTQEVSDESEQAGYRSGQTDVANEEQTIPLEMAIPHINGADVDREKACRLAERLFKLDDVQRVDVVKHLDKDNNFSRAVGEEYLKFFDFTGQTLDHALRSFLKVVVLIGETQERERVLQHFSCRFHECNPDTFCSSGAVLALTCALMLLNTDLHGQHVGKSMSSSKFVSNLDGMNDGENFSKDLLKSLYNSIKSEPLEWAVDEEELKGSVLLDDDAGEDAPLRSKANPFLDVPHDKEASVIKEGFLQRKLHADIDGKRTPWGKRGWKIFNGVLRGMVLYLQKDDYRKEQQINEEVVSVHHSLAEQAADYTKKPHVFRLQTADWRVFLFQASSKAEMLSWINRINLASALHSSPPFPAAVGSQRRFCRPILPASQSAHTLDRQLQFHTRMLESFRADLSHLHQNPPEGRKVKAKELEEHRVRAEYLQHEMCRYEIYIQVLEAWGSVKNDDDGLLSSTDLNLFDKSMCVDSEGEEAEEEGGLKKSHSSPSLELELAPPPTIKVKRNISERRTYRRPIIPRWNKEA
ncbi:PH and SEC7 domain-containing protein 1 isoform X2 [Sphaeramia orbicularis]|uniref:PH and SEC7 domain-containing protein 1 isoform X2 n=1 Tax=Sphaeramia orbicularis TaxID=375764 RepID=UPI00117F4087|nr:PH and SEC7 domain-containing protein 1-like isoform X2 [Sphaeramia orbicularis]